MKMQPEQHTMPVASARSVIYFGRYHVCPYRKRNYWSMTVIFGRIWRGLTNIGCRKTRSFSSTFSSWPDIIPSISSTVLQRTNNQIGRASCRERVKKSEVEGVLKKKNRNEQTGSEE